MDALLILTYATFCWAMFKIFKIPVKIALIDISIQRLMNRVGLHLSLGGSFTSN